MSNRGEMWVHGNSVVVQYPGGNALSPFTLRHRMTNAFDYETGARIPWSDLLGVRSKSGATFRGAFGLTDPDNTNVFHFSIPTPAIVPWPTGNHLEITVDVVSVYYKFFSDPPSDQITIQSITVSDGRSEPRVIDNIPGGRHNADNTVHLEENRNSWHLVNPIHLRLDTPPHGVLISVEVRFDVEGEITFTAAGIHYQVG